MSNSQLTGRSPRVLFFGMQSTFSTPSLVALLEQGIEVCAVAMPANPVPGRVTPVIQRREVLGGRSVLPMAHAAAQASIVSIARERQIPVWEVHDLAHVETRSTLAAYQPDSICVACFSRRIPRALREIAPLGCLNVHPSLLPANRGPVPLFWALRKGHTSTGVTIHLIDEGMDSGDILVQERVMVPDGISYAQLEAQCAVRGGALLAQTVWKLYEGDATRLPQDEAKASYDTFPVQEDFVVHAEVWEARHLYNFICGVSDWAETVRVYTEGREWSIERAISYSHKTESTTDEFVMEASAKVWVHCRDGSVCVEARAT